jgi:uncharacterized protein YaaN involved in tellurite resistance
MGSIYTYLKFFFFGFCIAFIINLSLSCSDKESPTQPEVGNPDFSEFQESEAMQKLSEDLISAFKSNNKSKVIEYLSDEVKEIYSEILNSSTKSLSDYGSALESRKLIFANELFAEYEITINGEVYTLDYGNGGDNVWKLLRL